MTKVPAGKRNVSMVFQSYALFPHLTVKENIGFGLAARRVPKQTMQRRVQGAAELVGCAHLFERHPYQLSGGERQRVALARALVRRPDVYLLDEPLSNLDAQLRVRMRAELKQLHQRLGATMIYVTHDQVEALTLGDRVAVLNEGVLQQVATPTEIYRRPVNRFVGTFIGSPAMNVLPLENVDGVYHAGPFVLGHANLGSQKLELGIRPEQVLVAWTALPRVLPPRCRSWKRQATRRFSTSQPRGTRSWCGQGRTSVLRGHDGRASARRRVASTSSMPRRARLSTADAGLPQVRRFGSWAMLAPTSSAS